MKTKNRIMRSLLSLAIAIAAIVLVGGVDAQAKSTYKYDAKKGVVWEPVIRKTVRSHSSVYYEDEYDKGTNYKNPMYFYNYGDTTVYVAAENSKLTAKSDSSDLLVKVSKVENRTGDSSYSAYGAMGYYDSKKDEYVYDKKFETIKFQSKYLIEVFAKKAGTYNVTVSIKKGKKNLTTKKIKVYATENGAFKEVKYAGTTYDGLGSFYTKKSSGAFKVSMNYGYKLQKLEIGTFTNISRDYSKNDYSYDEESGIKWKKFKNGKKIKLAAKTKYFEESGELTKQSANDYTYSFKYNYDYLFPVTPIRVTYLDKLTGYEHTGIIYITNVK